jgi:hypothetical protein
MHLSGADGGAARLGSAARLADRHLKSWRPDSGKPLCELTGGAAGRVGLVGRGVIDNFPARQVASGQQCRHLCHRRGERKVAASDYTNVSCTGSCIDGRKLLGGQSRRTDHHAHAALYGCVRVSQRHRVRRVVDEYIDTIEGFSDVREHRNTDRLARPGEPEVLTCRRPTYGASQPQIVGGEYSFRHCPAGRARGARDANRSSHLVSWP